MILKRITVENWRCLLGEHSVGPFSDGVNILHAPNATGKSTLFEALRCALMDNHATKGEEAAKLRPWGRALSPRVTVEFGVGGREYRVRKSFLDAPESILERLENGNYKPLAEGPRADAMTRELFTRDAPKKGMSRPEHWGLQQVLWAPQGRLELGELSGNLLDDIRQSLSDQVVDSRTKGVEERLRKRFELFFTPTGKVKTGGDLVRYGDEIESVRAELEKKKMQYAEAESSSKNVRALSEKVEALREEAFRAEADVKALEEKAGEFIKVRAELAQRAAEAKAAEAHYGRLKETMERIAGANREREIVQKSLKELLSTIPELEAQYEACGTVLERAATALEAARKERNAAEECANRAREARRFVDLQQTIRSLAEKIDAVKKARGILSAHEREKASGNFPGLAEIRQIRKAFADFEQAKIRLDASLITLEIVPAKKLSGSVQAGDATGPLSLEAGTPVRLQGAPEVRVDIESFGSLRVFGPCESAEEAREDAEKAEARLRKLTEPFGTSDATDLEELHERGASLDSHIERERAGLNALLGKDSAETLAARHAECVAESTVLLERFTEWGQQAPNPQGLALAAKERLRNADELLRTTEASRERAAAAYSEKGTALKVAEGRKKSEDEKLRSLEERLLKLESDGRTHEERRSELTALSMSWDSAKARAEEYRAQLDAFGGDPVEKLERTQRVLQAKSGELKHTENECIRATAQMDAYAAQGLYTAVAELEEHLAELEKRRGKEQLAADSIRLLSDTFASCRSEMAATVTHAAATRATEIFARIAGTPGGRLLLGESMKPSGFIPAEADNAVDVDALSGGEREQLHFAVRMALADCAGSGERRLLVLDDTLLATDGIRFPRILDVIGEAAGELQILILTCQPERFVALTEATMIDLGGIRARTV